MALKTVEQLRTLRAAQYVRMSTDRQQYSTQNQADAIAAYAAPRGLTIVRTYSDEGCSGLRIERREGLQNLIRDVKSGHADYAYILVYDVSRWGRFQDADESAYYEFLCKEAGIQVLYCAEQFENDGTLASTILKNLKRAMAGEYSRELSVKTFMGQCRITRLGLWRGGFPGYGLRRQLIDERGRAKGQLEPGQQKSLQSDRCVVIHGPSVEVETVRRIFMSFADESKSETQIAAELNADQITTLLGNHWRRETIMKLLTNERYLGHIIFNRTSEKLRRKRVPNPPEMWVRRDHAFPPIVAPELFERAQEIIRQRRQVRSEKDTLARLVTLRQEKGYLTGAIIGACDKLPSAETLRRNYGSLAAAYKLIDYQPSQLVVRATMAAKRRSIIETTAAEIVARITQLGGKALTGNASRLIRIEDEFSVSLGVATARRDRLNRMRWYAHFDRSASSDLTLVVRVAVSGTGIEAYYLVPTAELVRTKRHWLRITDKIFVEACRYENLDAFCRTCLGVKEPSAA